MGWVHALHRLFSSYRTPFSLNLRYSFEFFPVPHIISGSTFRMKDIARTPLTRKPSTSPIHLLATNSADRIHSSVTKNGSTRNTVIMPVDADDTWKAKTVLMDHETTIKTCVRASISLEAASITSKRIESWKKGELVIMHFRINKRFLWWVQNTRHIQCEVTRRTMIKQFFVTLCSAKTTRPIRIFWWFTSEELKRMQRVVRVVYLCWMICCWVPYTIHVEGYIAFITFVRKSTTSLPAFSRTVELSPLLEKYELVGVRLEIVNNIWWLVLGTV